jgi:beta-glucosidase
MGFRKDFIWGAAAAAYQIEGAWNEDGKGPSVWDMFCRKGGTIWKNQSGDQACDHYHRWQDDIALMKEIGLQAYRLSISWPRVLPGGTGMVNEKGLAFYDRLVDGLLEAGIEPWVTLFHWDFPYELYLKGGWLNRDSADWFASYASLMGARLGDRVRNWFTLNEPQCYIGLGLQFGAHAPGDRLGMREQLTAAHHTLLAHGRAVQALRSDAPRLPGAPALRIGMANVLNVRMPADPESPEDQAAALAAMAGIDPYHLSNNRIWFDPVYRGEYPVELREAYGPAFPDFPEADLKDICQSLDFCAINIYQGDHVAANPAERSGTAKPEVSAAPGAPSTSGWTTRDWHPADPLTAFKWRVTPDCLYWGPRWAWEQYGLPVLVSENGMSGADWVSLDGKVHDPQRIDFMARYLREFRRAANDGVDALGYLAWSVMDNFEWAEGLKERFGLIHVDYRTLARTIKDSGHWYRGVIHSNGNEL